jgi:hypothetical protein
MQLGGDLQDVLIMCDHVKHWTTRAYDVYDSVYCQVITVAICDIQSEDVDA